MLTVEGVVPFLLQRGLIQERLVVDDNLQVVDVSRRNHNFKLISDAGPGFFLKQGAPGEAALTVAHEAQLYRWFSTHPSAERLTPLLPRCRLYDAEQGTLVLELVEEGQSIHEYHRRHRQLPGTVGSALGDALGTLHRLTPASRASDEPVPGRSGRFLQLHRPDMDAFTTASSGGLEVLRLVQQSGELCGLLDGLHQEWWERCVIHGDLRWDNCQLASSASDVHGPRVQFVDWEMAGVGDPCWDAGTVFSECLSTWLRSTPVTRETPPEDFLRWPVFRYGGCSRRCAPSGARTFAGWNWILTQRPNGSAGRSNTRALDSSRPHTNRCREPSA